MGAKEAAEMMLDKKTWVCAGEVGLAHARDRATVELKKVGVPFKIKEWRTKDFGETKWEFLSPRGYIKRANTAIKRARMRR